MVTLGQASRSHLPRALPLSFRSARQGLLYCCTTRMCSTCSLRTSDCALRAGQCSSPWILCLASSARLALRDTGLVAEGVFFTTA